MAVAIMLALAQMGISLGPLLAGLGVVGFILGFLKLGQKGDPRWIVVFFAHALTGLFIGIDDDVLWSSTNHLP